MRADHEVSDSRVSCRQVTGICVCWLHLPITCREGHCPDEWTGVPVVLSNIEIQQCKSFSGIELMAIYAQKLSGRTVAVDWAIAKAEFQRTEAGMLASTPVP